jgi:hypothetical protein
MKRMKKGTRVASIMSRANKAIQTAQAVIDAPAIESMQITIMATNTAGQQIAVEIVARFMPGTATMCADDPWSATHWGDLEPDRLSMAISQGQAALLGERRSQIEAAAKQRQQNKANAGMRKLLTFTLKDLREAAGRAQRENKAAGRAVAYAGNRATMAHLGIGDSRVYKRNLTALGKTHADVLAFMRGMDSLR